MDFSVMDSRCAGAKADVTMITRALTADAQKADLPVGSDR